MITKRAQRLSRIGKREIGIKGLRAARLLVREMKLHCKPTREEFADLMSGVLLSSEGLWDLVLLIPGWATTAYSLFDYCNEETGTESLRGAGYGRNL